MWRPVTMVAKFLDNNLQYGVFAAEKRRCTTWFLVDSGELCDYPALTGVRGMCGRTCQQSIKIAKIEKFLGAS